MKCANEFKYGKKGRYVYRKHPSTLNKWINERIYESTPQSYELSWIDMDGSTQRHA